MEVCKHCDKPLTDDQNRFCSTQCESRHNYMSQEQKLTRSRKKTTIRRKDCEVCGTMLVGRQTRFCSITCKNEFHQAYTYQKQRGLRRKLELVELLGGKCMKCGYDKNLAALAFHHEDEDTKNHKLDLRSLSNRTIEAVMREFEKCSLLCANCHMETHHPGLEMAQLYHFIQGRK